MMTPIVTAPLLSSSLSESILIAVGRAALSLEERALCPLPSSSRHGDSSHEVGAYLQEGMVRVCLLRRSPFPSAGPKRG